MMTAHQVVWNGTPDEAQLLTNALSRHCTCELNDKTHERITTCPGHDMLLHNQKQLDGLLFSRRIAARLQAEEQLESPPIIQEGSP